MEKRSLKEKEAKLLGGLLHTQVDQIFIWRTTFKFLFGGLPFTFYLEDYFILRLTNFLFGGLLLDSYLEDYLLLFIWRTTSYSG